MDLNEISIRKSSRKTLLNVHGVLGYGFSTFLTKLKTYLNTYLLFVQMSRFDCRFSIVKHLKYHVLPAE